MEIPVHDIVNTGEETFRVGNGVTGLINLSLTRWDWRKIIPSKLFLQAIYQPALGISPSGWKRQGSPIPTVEGQNKISPCNENILVGKNENEHYISYFTGNFHRFLLTALRPTLEPSPATTWSRSAAATCSSWTTRRRRSWWGKRATTWLWWSRGARRSFQVWTPPSPSQRRRRWRNRSPTPRWHLKGRFPKKK